MPSRNPERYGAFGRLDPRLSALFRMPAKKMESEVAIKTEPPLPGPVERTVRISEPGCHDFGELSKD